MSAVPVDLEERDLVERLEELVHLRLIAGRFHVPSLPEVVARCLDLVDDPSFSVRQGARLIERDPGLAAQVVRLASAAAYGSRSPVRTLEQALLRVGINQLRCVLIEACAQRLFDDLEPRVKRAIGVVWEHSRAVAALARELCPLGGDLDREACYLAGLLHDIGKPVAASIVAEAATGFARALYRRIPLDALLRTAIAWHEDVGRRVVDEWRLPDVVAECVGAESYDPALPLRTRNVVCLAHLVARREGYADGAEEPGDTAERIEEGCALLSIDPAQLAVIVRSLDDRVALLD